MKPGDFLRNSPFRVGLIARWDNSPLPVQCRTGEFMCENYIFVMEREDELMSPVSFPWKHYYKALTIAVNKIPENDKYYTVTLPYSEQFITMTFVRLMNSGRLYLHSIEKKYREIKTMKENEIRSMLATFRFMRNRLDRAIEALEDILKHDINED